MGIQRKNEEIVLFLHGILGHPDEFHIFDEVIPDCFDVYKLLLVGHVGRVEDFSRASMQIWQEQVDDCIASLSKKYKKIHIVAHSMGCLFALERIENRKIASAFLMNTPLFFHIDPLPFLKKAKHMLFPDDAFAPNGEHSGIQGDWRIWKYLGWISNFLSLVKLMVKTRNAIKKKPSMKKLIAIHSKDDELVRKKSIVFLKKHLSCECILLEHSTHYKYDDKDILVLQNSFRKLVTSTGPNSSIEM